MKPEVIHYTLAPGQMLCSTYRSTLIMPNGGEEGPITHPGSFSARGPNLKVHLYHGRDAVTEDMDDWGFGGPTFDCGSVAHDPDLVLLQDATQPSLELARRLGLATTVDTITLPYTEDLITVPAFRDGVAAYFGDFSITSS